MRYLPWLLTLLIFSGCGAPEDGDNRLTPAQREAREKNVFWQYTKPVIHLDPVEKKDTPPIIYPGPGEDTI